jgi:hypothetical protein
MSYQEKYQVIPLFLLLITIGGRRQGDHQVGPWVVLGVLDVDLAVKTAVVVAYLVGFLDDAGDEGLLNVSSWNNLRTGFDM